jgi:hypothetical protein
VTCSIQCQTANGVAPKPVSSDDFSKF